jgi:hypothetical protein
MANLSYHFHAGANPTGAEQGPNALKPPAASQLEHIIQLSIAATAWIDATLNERSTNYLLEPQGPHSQTPTLSLGCKDQLIDALKGLRQELHGQMDLIYHLCNLRETHGIKLLAWVDHYVKFASVALWALEPNSVYPFAYTTRIFEEAKSVGKPDLLLWNLRATRTYAAQAQNLGGLWENAMTEARSRADRVIGGTKHKIVPNIDARK